MSSLASEIARCRHQFPGLSREVAGRPAAFFDGPGGSQVPSRVIHAVAHYLTNMNANHGGLFVTSQESDDLLAATRRALADFLGTSDPDEIVFGANMTTLTLSLSRALARTWQPGDEIMVTRLDHDANFTPWVLAARDAGATVRYVDFDPADCTLDLESFQRQLSSRTRLVAVGCASNAVGTINPIRAMIQSAHLVGALVFLDAVHYAPHAAIDVADWQCDFLACSAYKFFGPHLGILWGRRELLKSLPVYKVRPAAESLPDRWMTGTQSHEAIAGTFAAIDHLAGLAPYKSPAASAGRRATLLAAFERIAEYENELLVQLLEGLKRLSGVEIWGITDPDRLNLRVPTVSITHKRLSPHTMAAELASRGIFVWHGNFYALPLTEALGLEPDGLLRIGILHYNTAEEVDRLIEALAEII